MSRVSEATTGLVMEEPLLWEMGRKGRGGFSMPPMDVEEAPPPREAADRAPDLPELSEPEVARHFTRLSQWNFSIDTGMMPLGSCTMKYNPKLHEQVAQLEGFASLHPLLPQRMARGVIQMMGELQDYLAEITGMDAVSLQPSAGAQGELAGMVMIRTFLRDRGDLRTKILIPDTAHGTNPASAALCGFCTVQVPSKDQGMVTAREVARLMDRDTAGIMVTNPNTLGLFEEEISAVSEVVHEKGGLVYCDGANLNALMGMADMGAMGVDLLHLNLHKTFSAPHGGGGPGAGPICVRRILEPYLPVPRIVRGPEGYELCEDFPKSIGRVHGFYGNVAVMLKAYAYLRSMGPDGLARASQLAVLNANYLRVRLSRILSPVHARPCMHECVFSDQTFRALKLSTHDVAKRLMDYGFHPPTVYFPLVVPGALMVEPTETETKETLDRFAETMASILEEARKYPEKLREAPCLTKVRRLDETSAARHPCLAG